MVIWFFQKKSLHSNRRMRTMMMRVGLDPETTDPDTLATMKAVKSRCSLCNAEDYCERWLKGEVKGSNDFCPNAHTFEELKQSATAEPAQPTTASAL
jgi:hypothetical protein